MTAPDPTWRDRALKAEAELGERPLNTKEWVAASHDTWQLYLKTEHERDALAKRCAAYRDTLEWVCRDHEMKPAVLISEISADCVGRKILAERDRLRAKLDVAVEALTFYSAREYWDADANNRSGMHINIGHEARAALAKIAAKEGG